MLHLSGEFLPDRMLVSGGRKVLLNELTSGTEYCARCRAIGAEGVYGMWSDIATKKAY